MPAADEIIAPVPGAVSQQPLADVPSGSVADIGPVNTDDASLAILLAKHHGASSAAVGVMFAIVGAGGVLGAIAAAPIRRRLTARTVIAGEEWLLLLCVITKPGKCNEATTLLAESGPRLVTMVVKVTLVPCVTLVPEAFIMAARLARRSRSICMAPRCFRVLVRR